jgi:3-polyprenyl-4-hydroxybenzoate decarboxylase
VDDLIDGTLGRILLRLGIDNELYTKWKGMRTA